MAAEIGYVIIFHDAFQCCTDMAFVTQIAQPADMRHVLSRKLVDQTSFSQLEIRNFYHRVVHIQKIECFRIGNFVFVVFAVEKILIHPSAA